MNFKKLNISLKQLIPGVIKEAHMKSVAKFTRDMVVERTKRGFGVEKDGSPQKRLKGLSESYKKERKRLRRQGKLSGDTSPTKSNLTKRGNMLNDVTFSASDAKAEVFIKTDKNRSKAVFQQKNGREFMNLSKSELDKIKKKIEDKIKDDIKKKGL